MIDLDILGYEIKKRTEYVLLLGKIATQDIPTSWHWW
jgi:hypothetical protein